MKDIRNVAYTIVGFVAGMWGTFLFMRSVIVQEFGPTGLTGGNATFMQLSNEILDDMAVLWILGMGVTLVVGIVLVVLAARQHHHKK